MEIRSGSVLSVLMYYWPFILSGVAFLFYYRMLSTGKLVFLFGIGVLVGYGTSMILMIPIATLLMPLASVHMAHDTSAALTLAVLYVGSALVTGFILWTLGKSFSMRGKPVAKEVSLKDIETSVSVPSHLTSTETHRIVVDIAAQDYIQASWLHHNLTPLRITGVIVIASLIGTFAHKTGVLSASICVGGVLGYLTWYFLYYFVILKARCEKLYDQQKTLHTPIEVGWTDEQVEFVGANGTTVLKWSDYVKHKENSRLFLLYQSDLLFNVVPKSSFASPEQLRDFSSNLKD